FPRAKYLLAERQPVCGPKAPKFNSSYPSYGFSVIRRVNSKKGIEFDFSTPESERNYVLSDLANAHAVNVTTIVNKFISSTKFSLIVSSVPGDLSAETTCVYTYHALVLPETKGRVYSLNKITEGTIPLKENATLSDGCLTSLIDGGTVDKYSSVGNFRFVDSVNNTCESNYLIDRIGRYFDLDTFYVSFYVESVGEITFNISDTIKYGNFFRESRRSGLVDYSFKFVDNAAFATTVATTTVAATSTFVSTAISTVSTVSTTAKSASASGSGSAAASASVPIVAIPTTAGVVPTAYVAPANPTAYVAPAVPAYGVPANNNNNNLYKGAAVEKVGIIAAFVAAVLLA
ncbi:hypothetical protein HDU99_003977, partial [Rhizoclosmatium hyalinum]